MRPLLPLLLLILDLPLQAQKAFSDSLYGLAGQITHRLAARGYSSVAMSGLEADTGLHGIAMRIENELTYGLVAQGGEIRVVERALLDLLLDEQRLSAAGLTSDNNALALGELIQAEALVSGKLMVEDKRHVRLELKLLNTTTSVLEGMWRTVLPVPEPAKAEIKPLATPKPKERPGQNASSLRVDLGGVWARYFGQERTGAMAGISFTDGQAKPVLTLGLRLQWMPIGNYVPRQTAFGLYTTNGADYSSWEHPSLPGNGDLYLVRANDLSFGAAAMAGLMAAGAMDGHWRQMAVTASRGDRFTLLIPFRLYLGQNTARPYFEAGLGFDFVTMRNSYEVTSIAFAGKPFGEYEVSSSQYTAEGVAYEGAPRTIATTSLQFGAGLEIGQLSLQLDLLRAAHANTGLYNDARKVKGDPMAIALLNGPALEESRVLGELDQSGGILIGNTGADGLAGATPMMGRFLSNTSLQLSLAFHF